MTIAGKIHQPLADEMQKRTDDEKLSTIVVFKSDKCQQEKAYIKDLCGEQEVKYDYTIIPGMAVNLTKSQIEEVAKLENVNYIEYDAIQKVSLMDTARPWFGVDKAVKDFKVTGKKGPFPHKYSKNDIVIAVLDTGIDANHVDLANGKVIGWHDEINPSTTEPYDDNGHGTHVAGIAAGAGKGQWKYRGVAFGAALVGVKVINANDNSSPSIVIAGIQWCVNNKDVFDINIINMSLGFTLPSLALIDTTNNAVDAGIVVCAAAGNSGPATETILCPGDAEKAITVGAMADVGEGGFNLALFSSRGPTAAGLIKPDICGPGVNIMAPRANTVDQYISFNGTSMATPFVAGVAALMLDANPDLTPQQVKDILISTAKDWGPSGKDVDYGFGRLDGYSAVKKASRERYFEKNICLPNLLYAEGSLPGTNFADWYEFEVCQKCTPVAITMIMPDWIDNLPDFDMMLFDQFGNRIAFVQATTRQETIKFTAQCTGKYRLEIFSFSGSGRYFFNISVFGKELKLLQDNVIASFGGLSQEELSSISKKKLAETAE